MARVVIAFKEGYHFESDEPKAEKGRKKDKSYYERGMKWEREVTAL